MTVTPNELKERRAKRLAEKADVTARISDTTRFVAFGLLVAFYTVHAGENPFATALKEQGLLLFVMGVSAAFAILFDYVQYVCGRISVEAALRRPTVDYDETSWSYRVRVDAFAGKQALVIVGSLCLVTMVILSVF
jgi:hypothetical protein